jgi:hypothetical protein
VIQPQTEAVKEAAAEQTFEEEAEEDTQDLELPEGFEIIEDETAAANEDMSEENDDEEISVEADTEFDSQENDDDDDGFEFIEDNEEPADDYAEDVPLFKQREDKR